MEVILNELSVQDLEGTVDDARQQMDNLLRLCKKAKDELGCNGLRLPNADFFELHLVSGYTINRWLYDHNVSQIVRTLFNGLRRFPYFEEEEDELENTYILSKCLLNEHTHPSHGQEAEGLAAAWLKNTLAVSFCSHPVWSKNKIGLVIEKENEALKEVEVYHACTEECIDQELKDWFRKINLPPLRTHEDVDTWFSPDRFRLTDQAKEDLIHIYRENLHKLLDEIESLLKEIQVDPMRGTGKPKTLQGELAGWMSRRITKKHRLVYRLEDNVIHLYRCYEHLDDK